MKLWRKWSVVRRVSDTEIEVQPGEYWLYKTAQEAADQINALTGERKRGLVEMLQGSTEFGWEVMHTQTLNRYAAFLAVARPKPDMAEAAPIPTHFVTDPRFEETEDHKRQRLAYERQREAGRHIPWPEDDAERCYSDLQDYYLGNDETNMKGTWRGDDASI